MEPRFATPCLILLTDRTLLSPNWTVAQAIAPAVTGGVNLVVFGESELPAAPRKVLFAYARDGVKARVPLLTSGDPAFAVQVEADGAHLEDPGESVAAARAILGPEALLGITIRTPEEAARAAAEGADYVLVVYDWSNPEPALPHLRTVCEACRAPVIAGVDMPVELARSCMEASAAGVAICAPAMSAYNRTAACQAYFAAIRA